MKHFLMCAVAALCMGGMLAQAQDFQAEMPVLQSGPVQDFVRVLNEVRDTLSKVTDAESAAEAASTLRGMKARIQTVQAASQEALSKVSPAEQPTYVSAILGAVSGMKQQVDRVKGANFYGCKELKELFASTEGPRMDDGPVTPSFD